LQRDRGIEPEERHYGGEDMIAVLQNTEKTINGLLQG